MRNLTIRTLSILAAGFMVTSAGFAAFPEQVGIERECEQTAKQLTHMADTSSTYQCSGDLRIAAAYIDAASFKLQHQKIEQALTSIKYGELELKQISSQRAYCSHFSDAVKPIIATVIKISSQIEVLEHLQLKS